MLPSKTYKALSEEVEKVYRQLPALKESNVLEQYDEHHALFGILKKLRSLRLKAERSEKKR